MDVSKDAVRKRISISDDVIISAARLAALDVKGVAGLCGEVNKISKLRKNCPIKISMIGDVAAVDISIKVKGGERAGTVARNVQSSVKETVQNMTGITIARVNVNVNGVVFD